MSVSFHIGNLPNQSVQHALEMGRRSEELGFDGLWVADSHSVMRDAYAILAVLATQTSTLKLATGVTHTVTRHPAVLANSWATLQELSEGRAICGIGVGESAVHNLGLKPERLAVFEEKLGVIRALLNGETVEYEGKEIQMPWSTSPVPLIMASSGPRSLQLAGRVADGVLFPVGSEPRLVHRPPAPPSSPGGSTPRRRWRGRGTRSSSLLKPCASCGTGGTRPRRSGRPGGGSVPDANWQISRHPSVPRGRYPYRVRCGRFVRSARRSSRERDTGSTPPS